jgi:malonate decarboxylase beta subunit
MNPSLASRHSWFEATARKRVAGLLDPGSFSRNSAVG